MGFTKRFGGWRPVLTENGVGRLHRPSGETLEGVEYRFEVWHQMVDGFPGPYRSEGRVRLPSDDGSAVPVGRADLELADGRCLEVRLDEDGGMLAHCQPPEDARAPTESAGGRPSTRSPAQAPHESA